jgi:hypothetical protein
LTPDSPSFRGPVGGAQAAAIARNRFAFDARSTLEWHAIDEKHWIE